VRLNAARVRRALDLPPRVLARRVAARAQDAGLEPWQRRRDQRRPSYAPAPAGDLSFRLTPGTGHGARPLAEAVERYLGHRFDLLGSGWVEVVHGMACQGRAGARFPPGAGVRPDGAGAWLAGRVNPANVAVARSVWRLVSPGYRPIDWQLDFVSGFRWSELQWYRDIRYGDVRGADVKVPWELARMQHLPQLALAFAAGDARCAAEVEDQILDFIATNPPRWGVNWTCAMDVGIRAVNWLVAVDLLVAGGAQVRAGFLPALAASLVDHGSHIVANLEWSPTLRSNHYLADVAGLLFVAAYLPSTPRTDAWLGLALEQLALCGAEQFHPDGGNFEGSTSYHRLSTEMLLFCTALAAGLDEDRRDRVARADWGFSPHVAGVGALPRPGRPPAWLATGLLDDEQHVSRLAGAVDFAAAIVRPDGHVPQIGDNDSGRLVKLSPVWCRLSAPDAELLFGAGAGDGDLLVEDGLDHRHLPEAAAGLLAGPAAAATAGGRHAVDAAVVACLAGGKHAPPSASSAARPAPAGASAPVPDSDSVALEVVITSPVHIGEAGEVRAFPDFGLYVFRGPSWYLAVRCGPVGQGGRGGHDHNDQLSFELVVAGQDCAVDPGTYLYTPDPQARNRYRSATAHSGPFLDDADAGGLSAGLFELVGGRPGECLEAGPAGFTGQVGTSPSIYRRRIVFSDDSIRVIDEVPRRAATGRATSTVVTVAELAAGPHPWGRPPPYSPGYGRALAPGAPADWRARLRRSVVD
jgi:hypothetical protein